MTRHIDAKASEDKSMTDDEVLRVLGLAILAARRGAHVSADDLAEARAAVAALQAERDADKAYAAEAASRVLKAELAQRQAESALEALRGQVAGLVKLASRHEGHDPQLRAALLAMKNSGEF